MAIVPISPQSPEPGVIARAAALLGQGRLVAFPTETVYGLGANALDPAAVNRIYEVKGRPGYNPVIVHVADAAAARRLVTAWPEAANRLVERWWPGPLTLVLPKSREVPSEVTAGLGTVALRVPAHPVALALLKAAGVPVAAPSANRSGELSPTTAEHVQQSLGDLVPMILDAGPTTVGIESTVIDLSDRAPILLRPGMVSEEQLEEILGPIQRPTRPETPEAPRPSPGLLERHYAPKARLVLYTDAAEGTALLGKARAAGGGARPAVVYRTALPAGADLSERLPDDPGAFAREMYGALHRLDAQGVTLILVERPPRAAAWAGIRDRLERAAQG
ncbi:MAG TPA: L-threonylcarbamoyladenylate synthase [Gemmatimonadales bacterium]|nr:L-threonylcarbamoyladenylate synthase [Gemmatimonadales bacterium]